MDSTLETVVFMTKEELKKYFKSDEYKKGRPLMLVHPNQEEAVYRLYGKSHDIVLDEPFIIKEKLFNPRAAFNHIRHKGK